MGLKWSQVLGCGVVLVVVVDLRLTASSLLGRHNSICTCSPQFTPCWWWWWWWNAQGCKAFTAFQASTALPGFYKRSPSPPSTFLPFYTSNHNTILLFFLSKSIVNQYPSIQAFKASQFHRYHCYQSISQSLQVIPVGWFVDCQFDFDRNDILTFI